MDTRLYNIDAYSTKMARRSGEKRKCDNESVSESNKKKIPCKYGSVCYRKNADHLRKFSHEKESVDPSSHENPQLTPPKEEINKSNADSGQDAVQASPEDVHESIKQKFLVEMPQDFYKFWEFSQSCNPSKPEDALKKWLGLMLVGPYDVLAGKLKNSSVKKMEDLLCHWRYYYDPPEFQTIMMRDDNSLYHIGYYRDFPSEDPVFVASNEAAKGCEIKEMGGNIFAAINSEISQYLKKSKGKQMQELQILQKKLQSFAKEHGFGLQSKTNRKKEKSRKFASKTFHKAGIVVPVQGDVGYRPLEISEEDLKGMLKKIVESKTEEEKNKNFDHLQSIITNVQFANDECDYSMGYELGINLFCYGNETLHSTILFLLPLAYELLDRQEYAQIIRAHLSNRRKGRDLTMICK